MTSNHEFDMNATNLVRMIWEKRRIFIYIGIFAVVVSTIVSFLITPKFRSIAILYPPKASQQSKELITSNLQKGLTVFGEKEEAEQLLQILSSQTLRDVVLRKQDLVKHWGLDSSDVFFRSKAYGYFASDISFRPTQYSSVVITVYDRNPEKAAAVANEIIFVADSIMRSIKAEMAQRSLQVMEEQYKNLSEEVQAYTDSLDVLMRAGALHIEAQTREIYRALARAVENNNTAAEKRLRGMYDELARLGSSFNNIIYINNEGQARLENFRHFMRILKMESQQGFPTQFVVDKAVPSDKKAYPRKALIIVLSTLSALFFAVFALVAIDFFNRKISANAPV